MTDSEAPARPPALVAGTIIGVIIAVLLAFLLALLAGVPFGAAPAIGTLVVLVGWALYCTLAFGPGSDDDEPATPH